MITPSDVDAASDADREQALTALGNVYELRYRETREHAYESRSGASAGVTVGVTIDLCQDGFSVGAVEALLDERDLDAISKTSGVAECQPDGSTRALQALIQCAAQSLEGWQRFGHPAVEHLRPHPASVLAWARLQRQYPPLNRGALIGTAVQD
jgi:hypothetical protein